MIRKRIHVKGARILVLGLTFKENCPDLRNTKVVDVVRELEKYGAKVDVYDPWVDATRGPARVRHQAYERRRARARYDAIVLAVAHKEFREMGLDDDPGAGARRDHVLFDIKYVFRPHEVDGRL